MKQVTGKDGLSGILLMKPFPRNTAQFHGNQNVWWVHRDVCINIMGVFCVVVNLLDLNQQERR